MKNLPNFKCYKMLPNLDCQDTARKSHTFSKKQPLTTLIFKTNPRNHIKCYKRLAINENHRNDKQRNRLYSNKIKEISISSSHLFRLLIVDNPSAEIFIR